MSTDTRTRNGAGAAKLVICPYCGDAQPTAERCRSCRGAFEPLSRQATHNAMGPWFVHDKDHPYRPGCSYETLATMIERGQVAKYTIIRGPTTKQFWTVARRVPGVAHLLGYCHECDARVDTSATGCSECGALFGAYLDRNYLGLPDVRPLPWEAPDVGSAADTASHGRHAAPVWRSVSSFGADEEILAPAPGSVAPAPRSTPAGRSRTTETTEADPLKLPIVRAMQRRIERQQRTIRLLVAMVFAVAVIGAAFNLAIALRDRAPSPGPGTTPVAADAETDDAGNAGSAADDDRPAEDAATPGETPTDDAPGDDTSSAAADDAPPAMAGADDAAPARRADDDGQAATDGSGALDVNEDRLRADRLARGAADATRPVADRVADYEAALEILRGLAATSADPGGLEAEITRLEDRLERLRLGAFFR